MRPAGGCLCLGGLPGSPGRRWSPAGATPEGELQPGPVPENLLGESGLLAFWETRRSGEDPPDPGPLTSREASGSGQGCSSEKRHAGGLGEPPRLFSEKVSASATFSVQAVSRKGLGPQAGKQFSRFKTELVIHLTPTRLFHYFKMGREMTFFFFL